MAGVKLQVFEERLSDRTMLERRNLLIAACTGLLLHSGLPLAELLGINAELSQKRDSHIVSGAFAAAVLYLEVMFILYLWGDHCRYKLADKLTSVSTIYASIRDLLTDIQRRHGEIKAFDRQELHESLRRGDGGKGNYSGGQELYLNQMVRDLDMITDNIAGQFHGAVSAERFALRAIRIRHCALDIGLPLALGVLCLFKLADDLGPFLMKLAA